jgi:hypothetical protein
MGDDGYREQLAAFSEVEQRQFNTGETEYIPAVDRDGGPAAMPGASPSTTTAPPGRRRPAGATGSPGCPSARGRRDDFCSPAEADAVYRRAQTADKEFVWLDTTSHIDLYDNPLRRSRHDPPQRLAHRTLVRPPRPAHGGGGPSG